MIRCALLPYRLPFPPRGAGRHFCPSLLFITGLFLFMANGVYAQDTVERARHAAEAHAPRTSDFTEKRVEEYVTPFETANPAETGYHHDTFKDRIRKTREAGTVRGEVLRATEESARLRPDVHIDGQGPLFDQANRAHHNAGKLAGKYFTEETGKCTDPELPQPSVMVDKYCESTPARKTRTCDLIRKI